jgi:hypothetical protein
MEIPYSKWFLKDFKVLTDKYFSKNFIKKI